MKQRSKNVLLLVRRVMIRSSSSTGLTTECAYHDAGLELVVTFSPHQAGAARLTNVPHHIPVGAVSSWVRVKRTTVKVARPSRFDEPEPLQGLGGLR